MIVVNAITEVKEHLTPRIDNLMHSPTVNRNCDILSGVYGKIAERGTELNDEESSLVQNSMR